MWVQMRSDVNVQYTWEADIAKRKFVSSPWTCHDPALYKSIQMHSNVPASSVLHLRGRHDQEKARALTLKILSALCRFRCEQLDSCKERHSCQHRAKNDIVSCQNDQCLSANRFLSFVVHFDFLGVRQAHNVHLLVQFPATWWVPSSLRPLNSLALIFHACSDPVTSSRCPVAVRASESVPL